MPTIKTAISIDSAIYKKVEDMSKQLHISRSRFFSQAAQNMLDRKENLELLQKINTAYAAYSPTDDEKIQRQREKRYRTTRNTKLW